MLISVQANRPSARLPRSYALPEALIWFAFVKNGILIVQFANETQRQGLNKLAAVAQAREDRLVYVRVMPTQKGDGA